MQNLPGIEKWVKLKKGFLPHVSPSKICLFRNSPSMFTCTYGFGKRQSGSPAMWRGIYVEDAVVEVLTQKKDIEQAIKDCQTKFKEKHFIFDDKSEREYKVLEPMIQMSCDALADFGVPEFVDGKQEEIEIEIADEDWSIKGIGYLDLVFPNGQIIDLKTTHQVPSKMSFDHQLQRAFYKTARSNHQVRFLYVSKNRASLLEDGDEVGIMNEAKHIIKQMDTFCDLLSPEQARAAIPIQDTYHWTDQNALKNFYNNKE